MKLCFIRLSSSNVHTYVYILYVATSPIILVTPTTINWYIIRGLCSGIMSQFEDITCRTHAIIPTTLSVLFLWFYREVLSVDIVRRTVALTVFNRQTLFRLPQYQQEFQGNQIFDSPSICKAG